MILGANYRDNPNPDVGAETVFVSCIFTQTAPVDSGGLKRGVRLFPGDDTPRTFTGCAMINCEPPPGSTVIDCNTTIKEFGIVTSTEDVVVNGQVVATIEHHSDKVYGRWTSNGYEDKPTPELIEID